MTHKPPQAHPTLPPATPPAARTPTTALARSAARQLSDAAARAAGNRATDGGRKQTIHDVVPLPARHSDATQRPHLGSAAGGAVARAMARQSGVPLEQLQQAAQRGAGSADINHREGSGTTTPGHIESARVPQQSASCCCNIESMLKMCDALNASSTADAGFLLDALMLKLIAHCVTQHPAFQTSGPGNDDARSKPVNLAVTMHERAQAPPTLLPNAAHLGVASITRWLSAVFSEEKQVVEQHAAHSADAAHHDNATVGTFAVFNWRRQAAGAPQDLSASIPSLTITAMSSGAMSNGAMSSGAMSSGALPVDAGGRGTGPLVTLSLCIDAQRADNAACADFLHDLTALFAEPRRALL